MSKFTSFILFNVLMYFAYILLDKLFTFFDWYSNPQLGHDLTVMPTNGDIWLIILNTLVSSVGALYLLYTIKRSVKVE